MILIRFVLLDGIDETADYKQHINDLLLNDCCFGSCRVVATTRPEGAQLSDYAKRFAIISLKPLSDKQQCEAVKKHINDQPSVIDWYDRLFNFTQIRKEHNRIYVEEAFPEAESRNRTEGPCCARAGSALQK